MDGPKVVVKREGQICFSTAKIDDTERAGFVLGKAGKHILQDFQEPVDLAKFRIVPGKDLPLRIHNTQTDQKVAGRSLSDGIIFDVVMGQTFLPESRGLADDSRSVRLCRKELDILLLGKNIDLLEITQNKGGAGFQRLIFR